MAPDVECFRPHQMAWMRRPELDSLGADIWELPDGKLFAAPKGVEPKVFRFNGQHEWTFQDG